MALPLFKRDLILSIKPEFASKILVGLKTIELRRRFPEAAVIGSTILIYSSSPVCALVGSAQIKSVTKLSVAQIWKKYKGEACISKTDFDDYFLGVSAGFAIELINVGEFEEYLSVDVLKGEYGLVPPQSYRYVDDHIDLLINDERLQASNRHKRRHRA